MRSSASLRVVTNEYAIVRLKRTRRERTAQAHFFPLRKRESGNGMRTKQRAHQFQGIALLIA
jgi:hypothetical protein